MESKCDLNKLKKRVKTLMSKPQPEQRTPEWFKERQTRITASEAASCLDKSESVCKSYVDEFNISNFKYKTEPLNPYETKEDYIIKKCSAFYGKAVFKDNQFTLWGKKYEEVANRLYSKLYNTKVHEFGLISHNRVKWLAASPDGITENGIMIEIKCPKSRKIDSSIPPLYYWVQVQIQLEVCDLEECDFLECEIEEINTEEDFLNIKLSGNQDLGIIFQILDSGPDPKFIYPPIELITQQDYINWKNEILQSNSNPSNLQPIYYYISKYNVIRIKRSKLWFSNVRSTIKKTWEIIMRLQSNKDDFEKYKESIHLIKNKTFLEKWNGTSCLIHDNDSTFIRDQPTRDSSHDSTSLGNNLEQNCIKTTSEESDSSEDTEMCLIDSSE
jgi:putative phage-type endonuclease